MSGRDHPSCALYLPSLKTDPVLPLSQSLLEPFCKTIVSRPGTEYSFFWRCLKGQEPSVARAHSTQKSSDTEVALWIWRCSGKASSTRCTPFQNTCRPPQNHLNPPADTHRGVKPSKHPGQRDWMSIRARMSCWLDLPLSPFAAESRQPALIKHLIFKQPHEIKPLFQSRGKLWSPRSTADPANPMPKLYTRIPPRTGQV